MRPDAKSQVTLEYDDNNNPVRIDAIVVSTQHDDFGKDEVMLAKIKKDIINIVMPRVKTKYKKYEHFRAHEEQIAQKWIREMDKEAREAKKALKKENKSK